MSSLAPALEAFFTSWLLNQRRASPHTIAAYRDTFRLLLGFAQAQLGKPPAQLDLADPAPRSSAPSSTISNASAGTASAAATPASPPSTPSTASPRSANPDTPR